MSDQDAINASMGRSQDPNADLYQASMGGAQDGGGGGESAIAPTLEQTSASGTNPMSWSTDYADMIPESDYIRCRWRVNGGAFTYESDHLFTSDDYYDSLDGVASFSWPLFDAYAFPAGGLVEVQEGVLRAGGTVWSAFIGDTMMANVSAAGLRSEFITWAFGDGPKSIATPVSCQAGDKIEVSCLCNFNGAQSVTSITANGGAITFTKIGESTASGFRASKFYADTSGVTSLADITLSLSGINGASVAVEVAAIRGAATGGPASSYFELRSVGAPTAHDVDGGLSLPAGAVESIAIAQDAPGYPISFTGAAEVYDHNDGMIRAALASQTIYGDVTCPGPNDGGFGYCTLIVANAVWRV